MASARLQREDCARRVKPVDAGDGLAGLAVLAGGEGAAGFAINEHLDAGRAMLGAQAHVVGRAFIAKRRRHGGVHREAGAVGKGQLQLGQRLGAIRGCGGASSPDWRR